MLRRRAAVGGVAFVPRGGGRAAAGLARGPRGRYHWLEWGRWGSTVPIDGRDQQPVGRVHFAGSAEIAELKGRLYAVLLPVLAVTTLVTGLLSQGVAYDARVLPVVSGVLWLLVLLLLLGRLPPYILERVVYALFIAVYVGKVWSSLDGADLTQIYVWAPLLPVLAFVLFEPMPALVTSGGVVLVTGGIIALRAGSDVGLPGHVAEFFLATAVLLGMAYALSRLRLNVATLQGQVAGLHELAHEDALTKLPNRRQLEATLQSWLALASRNQQPLSLILFDLDDFKRVNDAHGHDAGDEVLRATARRGEGVLRRPDVLGRWGGEEFLVIAPGTDLRGAITLAERLRSALADRPFARVGTVTASFGVTSYRVGDGAEALLKRSDDAHYVAKQAGKNRVEALIKEYVQHVTMPSLASPFEVPWRDAGEAQRGTLAWLKRYQVAPPETLYRWVDAVQPGRLAANLHRSLGSEKLQIVADWYFWMFLHDDHCDATRHGRDPSSLVVLHERFLAVLRGAAAPAPEGGGMLVRLLQDLTARLGRHASEEQMARFQMAAEAYFEATRWEAGNRSRQATPDLETYERMRLRTSGVAVDTQLAQILDEMPASDHPLGAELYAAADRVVCWANDLYSLNKEVQENDVHNLVLSLQAAHGLGLEEALARAAAMHDAQVERFLRARERVRALEGPDRSALLEIADALQARMAGNSSWSERSIRYSAAVTVRVDDLDAGDRAVVPS